MSSRAHRPVLHFVYNVDGTPLAMALDFVHRIASPDTYPCRLCDVTYGRFLKKAEWRLFLSSLPMASRFHMRDRFVDRYPTRARAGLPAVFVETGPGHLRQLVTADELNRVTDLDALMTLIVHNVEALGYVRT